MFDTQRARGISWSPIFFYHAFSSGFFLCCSTIADLMDFPSSLCWILNACYWGRGSSQQRDLVETKLFGFVVVDLYWKYFFYRNGSDFAGGNYLSVLHHFLLVPRRFCTRTLLSCSILIRSIIITVSHSPSGPPPQKKKEKRFMIRFWREGRSRMVF